MSGILSGFTASYTDPNSGVTLPDAWVEIRQINYTPQKSCLVIADIYKDEASKNSGMAAIFFNVVPQIQIGSSVWNDYFDTQIMDVAGHNIQKQALDYLTEIL